MGLIRFLLAAAVVLGHAPGWGQLTSTWLGQGFLAPYYAVQAFFVISGFYMALIHEKYADLKWVFYVNRYSRLAVSYWIVAMLTLFTAALIATNNFPFEVKMRNWSWDGPGIGLAFCNLSMIGTDTVEFFKLHGELPSHWLLIPQSWSISAELWFYLLVPFLARWSNRTLAWLLAGSMAVRVAVISLHLPFFPWQQRLFPAELAFFLAGMFAYRAYLALDARGLLTRRRGLAALTVGAVFISCIGRLPFASGLSVWNSLLFGFIIFVLLPPIFHLTRRSRSDRFIGEFSYPVYLWHGYIGIFIGPAQRLWQGGLLLLLSVLFSLPLVLWVERPLENWRSRRLEAARTRYRATENPSP